MVQNVPVVNGWKRCTASTRAGDEKEVARARQRAHPSGGGFARPGRFDRAAGNGGGRGEGGPVGSVRHLRFQPYRVVRSERPLPPSAALSARCREATKAGSHDDLHPYSGYLHPYLRARAGGRLAGCVARARLDSGAVRRRAQASVDGCPALALGWTLPGDGLARRGRSLGHLPGGTGWCDSLDPGRWSRLQRRSPDLRSQASQPGARNIRVPRTMAPLRHGRKRLPFLGDAPLHRTALVNRKARFVLQVSRRADVVEDAVRAVGLAGLAYPTPVEDQEVGEYGPVFFWH